MPVSTPPALRPPLAPLAPFKPCCGPVSRPADGPVSRPGHISSAKCWPPWPPWPPCSRPPEGPQPARQEVPEAPRRQQALGRLRALAEQPPPGRLQQLARELHRGVERHRRLVNQHRHPPVARLAQVA